MKTAINKPAAPTASPGGERRAFPERLPGESPTSHLGRVVDAAGLRLTFTPRPQEEAMATNETQTKWTSRALRAVRTVNGWQVETLAPAPQVVARMLRSQRADGEGDFCHDDAYARLFAAAPKLASSLRALLDATVTVSGPKRRPIIRAREDAHPSAVGEAALDALSALAKAEGR